ncbi:MAG: UDP-N-acetylmuramate--L-alanine ligase [Lachnospiraceae bacterium]|nr:UDP-N-acetylmuramate--L-alanine ligase [Lachnospiraceae bacterium]
MEHLDLTSFLKRDNARVYFAGIGGISMSGLARLMLSKGFGVSGSDRDASLLTAELSELGAQIFTPQKAENIDAALPLDLLVYTAAIPFDHPELERARQSGIPLVSRADFLGAIMSLYPDSIAVSGTHGKTTTTSMISEILMAAGKDPTISLGGILPSIGGNFRVGKDSFFLAEACEYKNSFLSFFPKIGVILNVDADHLDFFKDLDDIRSSFRTFAQGIPKTGALVVNNEIPALPDFLSGMDCRILTYGPGGDLWAEEIRYDDFGNPSFKLKISPDIDENIKTLCKADELSQPFSLRVPGSHNVSNALAAIGAGLLSSISLEHIREGLSRFTGTDRRFQVKGKVNGFTIVDDYAHHPAEIRATIAAAKRYPHEKLYVAFQSHTYSRTAALLKEFASALAEADHVVLAEIYAAREENVYGISSKDLQREIQALGTPCDYFPTFEEIEKFLLKNCMHNDLCITMGAGNIVDVGDSLLKG